MCEREENMFTDQNVPICSIAVKAVSASLVLVLYIDWPWPPRLFFPIARGTGDSQLKLMFRYSKRMSPNRMQIVLPIRQAACCVPRKYLYIIPKQLTNTIKFYD